MKNHYKPWSKEEDLFLKQKYSEYGGLKCSLELGRSKNSVFNRAIYLKIRGQRNYPSNIFMDRIKTPDFAYILGFLWADGSLVKNRNGVVLSIKYEDGIEIKRSVDFTGTWNQKKKEKEHASDHYIYTVWDRSFTDFLKKFGYSSKNSRPFNLICDFLGKKLIPYFIHGFFDGDGCITVMNKSGAHTVSFAAPIGYDWSFLQKILKDNGVSKTSIYTTSSKSKSSHSSLYFRKKQDILIFYRSFIFGHKLGLKRKKDRFENFVKIVKEDISNRKTVSEQAKSTKTIAIEKELLLLKNDNPGGS